jgi:hypothetical protein
MQSLYNTLKDNYPLYNYIIDLYFKINLAVFFQTPEFQFYTTAITSPVISELPNSLGIQNIMGGVFEIPWDISFKILPSQIYSFGRNLAARVTNV